MTARVAALRALLRTPDETPCDARRGSQVTVEGDAGRDALKAQLAGAFLAHFLVALDDTFARGAARMKVYVGGEFDETPTVVARSLEQAMQQTLEAYATPAEDVGGFLEEWTCEFLDALSVALHRDGDGRGGQERRLYVERFDVDDTEPGPAPA